MKNWNYIEGAKTGNESIASHPDSLVAQEIYKVYLDNGKDENKALEVLASKYKNLPKEALQKHLKDAIKAYANIVRNSKTGAEEFFKQLSDDVKEREKKDDADIEKVGNANLETSVEKGKLGLWNWYVHKDGNIVSGGTSSTEVNAKEMARKALEKEKAGNKVGNAKDKNDKDLKVGDIVDVRGKKGKITKIIGDVIEVFYDNSGTYNPDRIDRHYADEAKKVGNSASDDKFAYVMREFDEGKLKTPDGKVVTDPAQAKAIAYSESKKTENGLARARNAIKKS